MEDECIFCRIAAGRSPAQIEYQDSDVVVFWDIEPSAPTHLLVVPRKHIQTLHHASAEDKTLLGSILLAAAEVARRKGLDKEGYRIATNIGANAHQVVDHMHFHLLGGGDLGPMSSNESTPANQFDE